MSYSYLTLTPSTDNEMKGVKYLLDNTKDSNGFFELYIHPENGESPSKEHYVGWIQIQPDGKIEFGHPG